MKLAEAISLRSDLQRKVTDIEDRIKASGRLQDGDKPAEDTSLLFKELSSVLNQLNELIYKINKTNLSSEFEGKTLTQLIAEKDVIKMRNDALREIINTCKDTMRMSSDTKIVCTLDLAQLIKEKEKYEKDLSSIKLQIQKGNWTFDLID